MTNNRWFLGLPSRTLFTASAIPTNQSHGAKFAYVVGPFDTYRGALFMALHGRNNPHCQTVADAERLADRELAGKREPDAEDHATRFAYPGIQTADEYPSQANQRLSK
jgi:hypothetical protein